MTLELLLIECSLHISVASGYPFERASDEHQPENPKVINPNVSNTQHLQQGRNSCILGRVDAQMLFCYQSRNWRDGKGRKQISMNLVVKLL